MSDKRLSSLDDLNVVASGVASLSSDCCLHVARIHSLDAIIDEFPEASCELGMRHIGTRGM